MRRPTLPRLAAWTTAVVIGGGALSAAVIRFEKFDKSHSTIGFRVPILGGLSEVDGKFTDFTITVDYDPGDLARSSVEAVVQTASINTGIAARDEDLRGDGFFDAAKFPEIRFRSTSIEQRGELWVALGELTMHGVTRPIELSFEITGLRDVAEPAGWVLGARAEAQLDRDDYGIDWRHPDPLFVGDAVKVEIHLVSRLTPKPAAAPSGP